MMWIRSKEALRAEDKQYGPWLCATHGQLQRSKLVIVMKHGSGGKSAPDNVEVPSEEEVLSSHRKALAMVDLS